ncbi:MAG TPA: GIY-YIG nuclease family protein [Alphaproteobacteria bacterium]|jgi:putative endonuclease|nr:GIY-YIG nuclease family protein [Alphaproteobacteria bacterium]
MFKQGFVYILGNQKPVLYIGVTSNLIQRIHKHRSGSGSGFSSKYKTYKLLYYEIYDNMLEAIKREKQLKNWHRDWKINLIKSKNPELKDLYDKIMNGEDPETSSG